jgi:hypothetical protein
MKLRAADWVEITLAAVWPVGLLGGSLWLLGLQAVAWLKTGEAGPTVTLADVMPNLPPIEWVGVHRIFQWFGAWPLWVVLMLPGGFLALGLSKILREAKAAYRPERH